MAHDYIVEDIPVAPLKLAAHKSAMDLAKKVDNWLVSFRKHDYEIIKDKYRDSLMLRGFAPDTFLLDLDCPRFGSGEAKGVIRESVRRRRRMQWMRKLCRRFGSARIADSAHGNCYEEKMDLKHYKD